MNKKVRNKFGETELFRIGKAVRQRCILSPHLFSLHSEYIIQMVGVEEMTAGIKIGGGNSNSLSVKTIPHHQLKVELDKLIVRGKIEKEKSKLMQTIRIEFILSCMFSEGNIFAFRDSKIQVDNVLEIKRRKQ